MLTDEDPQPWPKELDERLALARRILDYQPDLEAAQVGLTRDDLDTLTTALTEYLARRTR